MPTGIPTHHVRIGCTLDGCDYPVLAFGGCEGLSQLPRYDLTLALPDLPTAAALPGAACTLRIEDNLGRRRTLAGIVVALQTLDTLPDGRVRSDIAVTSALHRLTLRRQTRLLVGHSPLDVARQLLAEHGIDPARLDVRAVDRYAPAAAVLQASESDSDLLHRVLARAGLSYWLDEAEGHELLRLGDGPGQGRVVERPLLCRAAGGWGSQDIGAYRLRAQARQVADRVRLRAHLPDGTLHTAYAASGAPAAQGEVHRFAYGLPDTAAVEARARRMAERLRCEAQTLIVDTTDAGPIPGWQVSFDADAFDRRHSGDYLVLAVEHFTDPVGTPGLGDATLSYRNRVHLWPAALPWRPPEPAVCANPPLLYAARVQADGPYAQLDEAGRYRLRALFQQLGADGPTLRRLTPYAGTATAERPAHGWHAPLQDDQEVRLACLGGDPDGWGLVTAGSHDAGRPNPVNSVNPSENRYQTPAGNTLRMDDRLNAARISLHTVGEQTVLALHADQGLHQALLAAKDGALTLVAGRHHYTEVGEQLTETIAGDRVIQVQENATTKTNKADIHHQAATDIQLIAGQDARFHAAGDLSLKSHGPFRTVSGQGLTVHVKSGDFVAEVAGNLTLQASDGLRIEGDGSADMHVSLGGGGFIVHPNGNVSLYGKAIALDAPNVKFNGKVNYDIGSPSIPGAPAVPKPRAVPAIPEIAVKDDIVPNPQEYDLVIELADEFERQLTNHYTILDGTAFRITTDTGQIYTGKVEEQQIKVPKLEYAQEFDIRFDEQLATAL